MRHALKLANGFVVTTDNSGGIGEKQADLVFAPNDIVSYFATRVALLEQWAARSQVESVIIHNFSGDADWQAYVKGVNRLLKEVEFERVLVTGSSETNMNLLQSAMSVTMIGRSRGVVDVEQDVKWFIYGRPFVGSEVLENANAIADLNKVKIAMENGWVSNIWPVGSKGIQAEVRILFADDKLFVQSDVDVEKSAGPSTVVLVGVPKESIERATLHFGNELRELMI
jgi:hypothetical protein